MIPLLRSVHHIGLHSKNLCKLYDTLTKGFGFELHAVGNQASFTDVVVKSGAIKLLLQEKHAESPNNCFDNIYGRAFDVAVEVNDLKHVLSRAIELSGSTCVVSEPKVLTDYYGSVNYAVIKSCLPNIFHTLVECSGYRGLFLPGYHYPDASDLHRLQSQWKIPEINNLHKPFVTCLDHIAIACESGLTASTVEWYRKLFGMRKMKTNVLETGDDGFVVKHGKLGMKLTAMDYSSSNASLHGPCKFVFVEPLHDSAPNQLTRFLKANGGPGVQHLGLLVNDIFGAATGCRRRGVQFIDPPEGYYDQLVDSSTWRHVRVDPTEFRSSGVLVDSDVSMSREISTDQSKNLIFQIFTEALFSEDSFFLELIERRANAIGFGAGNITALWKAAEASRK